MYPPTKAAGMEPKITGIRTFMLNSLCLIKRKLATDETTIFKIRPIGFMIPTGVPVNDKIAI
jgi:hypothetical protein